MVLVSVVLFMVVYSMLTFGRDKKQQLEPGHIPMPDLEENQGEYGTKLEALEAIKEERETTPPQIYPDHMVDEKGYFNPDYMEYEKQRIIDSVYSSGSLTPKRESIEIPKKKPPLEHETEITQMEVPEPDIPLTTDELDLEHQLFFASNPKMAKKDMGKGIQVRVDGDQTVRDGHRLDLRLQGDAHINGRDIPRNTRIYGFVTIRPNRVMVDLSRLGIFRIHLKAHDLQDGNEGIYIENRLLGDLRAITVDKAIGEINIPGIPKVSGLKRIFQKDNRAIKVEIKDNYQILLKP